ncbi:transmembrane protein [Cystoisospora suis]|uniref:Transmembrane protein n=1 Tax=Cystoisospora suis TaxID=483139 RepID=A0A2C6L3X0_9APIC|nr:transmembrane protein [Cystoisospora suis]
MDEYVCLYVCMLTFMRIHTSRGGILDWNRLQKEAACICWALVCLYMILCRAAFVPFHLHPSFFVVRLSVYGLLFLYDYTMVRALAPLLSLPACPYQHRVSSCLPHSLFLLHLSLSFLSLSSFSPCSCRASLPFLPVLTSPSLLTEESSTRLFCLSSLTAITCPPCTPFSLPPSLYLCSKQRRNATSQQLFSSLHTTNKEKRKEAESTLSSSFISDSPSPLNSNNNSLHHLHKSSSSSGSFFIKSCFLSCPRLSSPSLASFSPLYATSAFFLRSFSPYRQCKCSHRHCISSLYSSSLQGKALRSLFPFSSSPVFCSSPVLTATSPSLSGPPSIQELQQRIREGVIPLPNQLATSQPLASCFASILSVDYGSHKMGLALSTNLDGSPFLSTSTSRGNSAERRKESLSGGPRPERISPQVRSGTQSSRQKGDSGSADSEEQPENAGLDTTEGRGVREGMHDDTPVFRKGEEDRQICEGKTGGVGEETIGSSWRAERLYHQNSSTEIDDCTRAAGSSLEEIKEKRCSRTESPGEGQYHPHVKFLMEARGAAQRKREERLKHEKKERSETLRRAGPVGLLLFRVEAEGEQEERGRKRKISNRREERELEDLDEGRREDKASRKVYEEDDLLPLPLSSAVSSCAASHLSSFSTAPTTTPVTGISTTSTNASATRTSPSSGSAFSCFPSSSFVGSEFQQGRGSHSSYHYKEDIAQSWAFSLLRPFVVPEMSISAMIAKACSAVATYHATAVLIGRPSNPLLSSDLAPLSFRCLLTRDFAILLSQALLQHSLHRLTPAPPSSFLSQAKRRRSSSSDEYGSTSSRDTQDGSKAHQDPSFPSPLPVVLYDEAYTTVEAHQLRRTEQVPSKKKHATDQSKPYSSVKEQLMSNPPGDHGSTCLIQLYNVLLNKLVGGISSSDLGLVSRRILAISQGKPSLSSHVLRLRGDSVEFFYSFGGDSYASHRPGWKVTEDEEGFQKQKDGAHRDFKGRK